MHRAGTSTSTNYPQQNLRLGDGWTFRTPRPRQPPFQAHGRAQRRHAGLEVRAALFDPPPFDPSKLSIRYLPGADPSEAPLPHLRRYTLTHNDLTGDLQLSVGLDYNTDQLSGWYTRIVRDEILAEWSLPEGSGSSGRGFGTGAVLNVYCHVSGEELWPAPPGLRSFIFQREMKLVLDTIAYAERSLLDANPPLAAANVFVHFRSDVAPLDRVVAWGRLGDRSTWQQLSTGTTLLGALLAGIVSPWWGRGRRRRGKGPAEASPPDAAAAVAAAATDAAEQGAGLARAAPALTSQSQSPSPPYAAGEQLERRTSTLAGRARGAVVAAIRRRPLHAGASGGGRSSSKMVVSVAAQRRDGHNRMRGWPAGPCDSVDGLAVEAVLSEPVRTKQ